MKTLVGILSAVSLLVAGSAYAAQQQQGEKLVQQCKQEAQKSGIQASDMEAFIDNCLNDKVGYERTKPGQDAGGGGE